MTEPNIPKVRLPGRASAIVAFRGMLIGALFRCHPANPRRAGNLRFYKVLRP